jgi:indole-3-glycerol phosphate synthase
VSVRLEHLLDGTRERLDRARRERPFDQLEELAAAAEPRPFSEALARPGTSLVAEYKRRSPSAGPIREGAEVTEVTAAYERGGAAAVSILTDEDHFGGSLSDVEDARQAIGIPILRKDFTIDRYQLYESKAAGADAVLLVARTLEPAELDALHAEARALDLDALVEVHTDPELERALELDVDVIGINNRDLDDFSVDLQRTFELLPDVPAGKIVVSESGIRSRADVEKLEGIGIDAILVGEALMRAPDPEAAVRELAGEEASGADAVV